MLTREQAPIEFFGTETEAKGIHDECGVTAVFSRSGQALSVVERAQAALQHRGQEAAGVTVSYDGHLISERGLGHVQNVITPEIIEKYGKVSVAIGHNRYPTNGDKKELRNAMPAQFSDGTHSISLALNGNLFDTSRFGDEDESGVSDGFMLAEYLLKQRKLYGTWTETFQKVLEEIENCGAFSLTMVTDEGSIYATKSPAAVRPLVLGASDDGYVVASETVALDMVGADYVRDLVGGELVIIDASGKISSQFYGTPRRQNPCIFEQVYFARPDSFDQEMRVRERRYLFGGAVAKRMKAKGLGASGVVVPILDSGYHSARGVADGLGLNAIPAQTASHWVGRTFIQASQKERKSAVKGKHNITPDGIQGKAVYSVDDSGVRFNTSRKLVEGFYVAGAIEVHMVFTSPPIVDGCDLGIDMPDTGELPASQWHGQGIEVIEAKIAELIGATSVTFLPFEDLLETRASEGLEREYCASCFGGVHPIREYSERFAPIVVPGEEFPRVEDESQRDMRRAKIFALASGNGTNVEVLAQAANDGVLDADFVGVGTNNPDAFVLSRAKRYDISEYIVEFQKDALKDPELRKEREDVIAEIIIESGADVLVLAGWMLILGDEFLQKMQEHGIVVLNLHPALLSGVGADQLQSSKGKVWEIRGVRAIEKAYDLPYHEMPASGVTVHQVLPAKVQGGVKFDVGPIVLREEVAKRYGSNESLEEWGNRIHEAEYRALPAAVNRVLHVINKGVDVSQGNYPW